MMMPLTFLLSWVLGLLSLTLLGGGLYVLWEWYVGELVATAWLLSGMFSVLWSLFGRFVVLLFFRPGELEPREERSREVTELAAADGSRLHVEFVGPKNGPPIILTHGWGLDSTAWYYTKRRLGDRFRLILWDLPGLGRSTQPTDGQYSVERLAKDLHAVLTRAESRAVVLVGHSIGGMIIQTFARLYPDAMRERVSGIVFANTTYTQPLRTAFGSGVLLALQKPLIESLLHITVWLWPIVWLMNLQSYLSGTSHITTRITSFGPGVTRGQLDFLAWFMAKDHPGVVAKGLLAVLRWDESQTLGAVEPPSVILSGDSDRLTLPSASEHMRRALPKATMHQLGSCGHAGLVQQGSRYSDDISSFAEQLGRASSREEAASTGAVVSGY